MSKIKIHNVSTNEIIEREMNEEELEQAHLDQESARQEFENAKLNQVAKTSLLERLGITQEEAKLLLS